MKTRLVRIGNSRGVVLPNALLDRAGLEDEVEIRVERGVLVIRSVGAPRAGWAAAAARFKPKSFVDAPASTRFDDEGWEW